MFSQLVAAACVAIYIMVHGYLQAKAIYNKYWCHEFTLITVEHLKTIYSYNSEQFKKAAKINTNPFTH